MQFCESLSQISLSDMIHWTGQKLFKSSTPSVRELSQVCLAKQSSVNYPPHSLEKGKRGETIEREVGRSIFTAHFHLGQLQNAETLAPPLGQILVQVHGWPTDQFWLDFCLLYWHEWVAFPFMIVFDEWWLWEGVIAHHLWLSSIKAPWLYLSCLISVATTTWVIYDDYLVAGIAIAIKFL